MAPKLRAPNRLEVVGIPTFCIVWHADPADGHQVVAYCGGGGSARTGVNNKIGISVNNAPDPVLISTGTQVGIALLLYSHPISKKLWLLVSFEKQVKRYRIHLPQKRDGAADDDNDNNNDEVTCELDGTLDTPDGCNCLAVNAMTDRLALGCENGVIHVHALPDDDQGGTFGTTTATTRPLYSCTEHHTAAVCAVTFAMRGDKLLSAAKDGTCCIWRERNGSFCTTVQCQVDPPPPDPKRRNRRNVRPKPLQVLVRGCAFADLEGNAFYTVASARRGKAFLARWILQTNPQTGLPTGYACQDRVACSEYPVSAMTLSADGALLALGNTDGDVTLWSTAEWRPVRVFNSVHGLPLTSVAPRPYAVPELQGEDDGICVHARTASADGTLAHLTLQTRVPRQQRAAGSGDSWVMMYLHRLLLAALTLWLFSPLYHEAVQKCQDSAELWQCLQEDVLIATDYRRPGIGVPPY